MCPGALNEHIGHFWLSLVNYVYVFRYNAQENILLRYFDKYK